MSRLDRARRRLRALAGRAALERDLDEELRFHLDMEAEQNVRDGLSLGSARSKALREFGGVARVKDEARDARGVGLLEDLGRDLRLATRALRRAPAFTGVALLTIALAIGATTAVFSLVDGVLLRPLPFPEPDRLVRLYERTEGNDRTPFAGANALDVQRASRALRAAYFNRWPVTVLGGSEAQRVEVSWVSREFFDVVGVRAARGRAPTAGEDPATTPQAVVSDRFWRGALGGATDLAGRTLRVGDDTYPVVGVMPPDFALPSDADVWVTAVDDNPHRTAHNWSVVGRLEPGATIEQARAELAPLMARLKQQYGKDIDAVDVTIAPLHEELARRSRTLLLVLMGAVAFVLLVACVNLASANLARGEARRQELAVRAALGAGRGRLVRHVLAEQLLVAGVGGALGVALAALLVQVLVAMAGSTVPAYAAIRVDGRVLLFATGVTLLTGLLIALAPAWQAAGGGGASIVGSAGRTAGSVRGRRVRAALVGAEVALALALLAGAGLLVRSLSAIVHTDPGFRTSGVLTASVSLPGGRYGDTTAVAAYYDRLLASLRAVPGVQDAGVISSIPIDGGGGNTGFMVDGGTEIGGWADYRVVDSVALRVLGVPLRRGRPLGAEDRAGAPHVALVNEAFARKYWPVGGPIGHRVRPPGMDAHATEWLTIVGVVGDVRGNTLVAPPEPAIYVHAAQRPENLARGATVVLHASTPPEPLSAAVRERVRALDPDVAVRLASLQSMVDRSLTDRRFSTTVLTTFAGLSLFLAAIGIYGVLAYTVAQRRREIGVRLALGAGHGSVRGLVLRDAMRAVLPGLAAGLVGAAALTRVLRSMLYGVSTTDPLTFAAVAALLLLVALLASWIPARRATRVDPLVAIRAE